MSSKCSNLGKKNLIMPQLGRGHGLGCCSGHSVCEIINIDFYPLDDSNFATGALDFSMCG